MSEAAVVTLAAAAGQALIRAMGTDAWTSTRDRIARLLSHNDADRAARLAQQLEASRQAIAAGSASEAIRWQGRLEGVLEDSPRVAEELAFALNLAATAQPSDAVQSSGAAKLSSAAQPSTARHSAARHSTATTTGRTSTHRSTYVKISGALVAVLLVAATGYWVYSSRSADAPLSAPVLLDLSPTSGARGDRVDVKGQGFERGERVRVLVHIAEVARVYADGNGAFTVTVVVPDNAFGVGGQTMFSAVGVHSGRGQQREFELTDGDLPRIPGR